MDQLPTNRQHFCGTYLRFYEQVLLCKSPAREERLISTLNAMWTSLSNTERSLLEEKFSEVNYNNNS